MPRKHNPKIRLRLECLEDRRLPSGGIAYNTVNGGVAIDGTALADKAQVYYSGGNVVVRLTSTDSNGTTVVNKTRTFTPSQVKWIEFHGYEGNDTFINSSSIASTLYGGADDDYLQGGSGADTLYGGTGKDALNGGGGTNAIYRGTGGSLAWIAPGEEYILSNSIGVWARDVIDFTNQNRVANGLKPLTISLKLVSAAQYHAKNMAYFNTMAHTISGEGLTGPYAVGQDLSTPVKRLGYYGYNWSWWGENIAYNYQGPRVVVNAWMNSPAHRANILNAKFTEIGVGIAYNMYGQSFFAQEFGRPL